MAKARNSDLLAATHKGRSSGGSKGRIFGRPSGPARNGRDTYARLTTSSLSNITPTPQGVEPFFPYGYGSKQRPRNGAGRP